MTRLLPPAALPVLDVLFHIAVLILAIDFAYRQWKARGPR